VIDLAISILPPLRHICVLNLIYLRNNIYIYIQSFNMIKPEKYITFDIFLT